MDQPGINASVTEAPDLKSIVTRFRVFILSWVGLCVALAVCFVLLSTPKWRGVTTLLVVTPDAAKGSAQLAILNQTASTPLRTIKGVVMSNRSTDAVIKKFNLDWKKFESSFKVVDESQTNQLIIEYVDTDRDRIIQVLDFSVAKLTELDDALNFTTGKRQATTLKAAVESKESEVGIAEKSLLSFQKSMKTISDPRSTKGSGVYLQRLESLEFELSAVNLQAGELRNRLNVSAQTELIPEEIPGSKELLVKIGTLEAELRVLKQKYTDDFPEVLQVARQLESAKTSFRELIKRFVSTVHKGLDPKLAELQSKKQLLEFQVRDARKLAMVAPNEELELSRRINEVATLRSVLSNLRAQYEQARVDSEVARVRWNVLDYPYIDRTPVNKSFRVPVLLAVVLGIGSGLLIASSLDRRRK